jgi:hypothetical protein
MAQTAGEVTPSATMTIAFTVPYLPVKSRSVPLGGRLTHIIRGRGRPGS